MCLDLACTHLPVIIPLLLLLLLHKVILLLLLLVLIVSASLIPHLMLIEPLVVVIHAPSIYRACTAIRPANVDAASIGPSAGAGEFQRRGKNGEAEHADDGHGEAGVVGCVLGLEEDDAEAEEGDEDDEEEPGDGESGSVG